MKAALGACVLLLLGTTQATSAQDPGNILQLLPRSSVATEAAYWRHRQVVSFIVVFDSSGALWDAILADNQASRRAADSLLAIVKRLRMPAGMRAEWSTDRVEMGFAMDRREALADTPGQRLPAAVRAALRRADLACWVRAWKELDPEFAPEDGKSHPAAPGSR